jgi:Flp pilus assembly protein TadG
MHSPRIWRIFRDYEEGQSLVELAVMVPILTVLICYTVDFGFLFLAAISLNSAARNATEYAVQGTSSPSQKAVPSAALVSSLAISSIGLPNTTTSTVSVRVCSTAVGTNTSNNSAQCVTQSSGAGPVSGTADTDPEAPSFQLNRVDVVYTVVPPIPIPTSIMPSLTFHRMLEMRRLQ